MKLNLLFESKNDFMYHATSYDRLKDILKQGLKPSPSRANKSPLGDNIYLSYDEKYANYMGSEYYADDIGNGYVGWVLIEVPSDNVGEAFIDEGYLGDVIEEVLGDVEADPYIKQLCVKIKKLAEVFKVKLGGDIVNQSFLRKIAPIIDKIPPLDGQINRRFRETIGLEMFSAVYVVGFDPESDDGAKVLKVYSMGKQPTQYRVGDDVL